MKAVLDHCDFVSFDGFLPSYNLLREYANRAEFKDIESPVDGVVYPGICAEVPVAIEVESELCRLFGDVDIQTMFMRLSTEDAKAPHGAHTDSVMGDYSLMLYMGDEGGTEFLQHECGMATNPTTQEQEKLWQQDTNQPDKWQVINQCRMRQNRACVFRSDRFHRASPSYGNNPANGRLVLSAFFNA